MQIIPVPTPLLTSGDHLAGILAARADLREGDILVVSSKALATTEGDAIDLRALRVTDAAHAWAGRCGQPAAFLQAVLDETARMHGTVSEACPQAALTELRPDGFPHGTLLTANAGLDLSNVADGFTVGWPRDPAASTARLRRDLEGLIFPDENVLPRIAVILSDSACKPRRLGVCAIALCASGIEPLVSLVGQKDLFGRELRMTYEAIGDQLATAANLVMGNDAQCTPAAIIRDHGLRLSPFEGWVPGIAPEEDLFRGIV
jgi:coenzyme F420-0:L-glutamate ligase/coenzyme F420-1:gamma-L-glutamate ligase